MEWAAAWETYAAGEEPKHGGPDFAALEQLLRDHQAAVAAEKTNTAVEKETL